MLKEGLSIGETSRLRLWNLVSLSNQKGDNKGSYMTPTDRGYDFMNGDIKIEKYLYLYKNQIIEKSDDTVEISEVQDKIFDLSEVKG